MRSPITLAAQRIVTQSLETVRDTAHVGPWTWRFAPACDLCDAIEAEAETARVEDEVAVLTTIVRSTEFWAEMRAKAVAV